MKSMEYTAKIKSLLNERLQKTSWNNEFGTFSRTGHKIETYKTVDDVSVHYRKNGSKLEFKIVPNYFTLGWHHFWDHEDGIIVDEEVFLY